MSPSLRGRASDYQEHARRAEAQCRKSQLHVLTADEGSPLRHLLREHDRCFLWDLICNILLAVDKLLAKGTPQLAEGTGRLEAACLFGAAWGVIGFRLLLS